ncbi:cytochrome c maturation protein CcmE [Pelagibacteraceae bacterium]|nr:cytochrome c maturation protein CcmE [Pelagibacteraceae bacterium]|tara:strand:+ start:23 stop:451 length:429 start_codon:yes stop_codon:yes gene_type:complete
MLTKKVKSRILFLFFIFLISAAGTIFILKSLNQNILYFSTPTEINQIEDIKLGKAMRVGGMVKKNSIIVNKKNIQFIVTDFKNEILISYAGTVPNLFAEEKGVVAEGKLKDKKFFIADRILAKHDEEYMPPEIKQIIENNAK